MRWFFKKHLMRSKQMPTRRLREEPPPPPLKVEEARERALYIRSQIQKVALHKKEGMSQEELKLCVPDFVRDFPHLFLMVSGEETYNEDTLETMLKMLDKMSSSHITQHDASVQVGTHLMNNYIQP